MMKLRLLAIGRRVFTVQYLRLLRRQRISLIAHFTWQPTILILIIIIRKIQSKKTSVKAALMYCIDKFYPEEYNIHDIIGSKELQAYKSATRIMGSGMAEIFEEF